MLSNNGNGHPIRGAEKLSVDSLTGSATIAHLAKAQSPWVLLMLQGSQVELGAYALERMQQIADATGAGIVYGDYWNYKGDHRVPNPVIDYQAGSIRDDFNFGSVVLLNTAATNQRVGRRNRQSRIQICPRGTLRLAISRHASRSFICPSCSTAARSRCHTLG